MSIYKIFAQNLREECRRFESIAAVCRDSGINRQQFNKYLSGTTIPNARTLEKLCKFLGVKSEQLFLSPNYKILTESPKPNLVSLPLGETSFTNLLQAVNATFKLPNFIIPTTELEEGYFNCYFPLEGFQNFLVRSLLKIKIIGNEMRFVRHTRIKSPSSKSTHVAFGKHHGFIIDDSTSIILVGRNLFPPYNVSTIYIRKGPMYGLRTKMGLAFTIGISNYFTSRVCLEHLGTSKTIARQALEETGIVSAKDSSVSPAISNYMSGRIKLENGMLGLPELNNIFEIK
jgi:transcriptional regulator with XRE-family HTH domain